MFEKLAKLQKNILIPLGVVLVAVLAVTVIEAQISDRFTASSVSAADFVDRFEEVPHVVGEWQGIDNPVDEQVKQTAGAVGHVSRTYTHRATHEKVDLWLIVGHARDTLRHTPNICYRSAGFRQVGTINKHTIDAPGEESAHFFTAQFLKEDNHARAQMRVFWAWNANLPDEQQWEAPDNRRIYYGNNRALYKIYFTSPVLQDEEFAGDSVAVDFAEEMLPLINDALFPEQNSPTAEPPGEEAPAAEAPQSGGVA